MYTRIGGGLSDFKRDVVSFPSVSETTVIFFSPHTAISSVYREWSEEEKIYRKPISLSEYALLARSLARLL